LKKENIIDINNYLSFIILLWKINRVYDPAYQNTAVARSKITEIDGAAGVLRYRGYPIEELAEKSNYLEVSYLLIFGELPNKVQYERWSNEIMHHTYIHIRVMDLMKSFNYDAHPVSINKRKFNKLKLI